MPNIGGPRTKKRGVVLCNTVDTLVRGAHMAQRHEGNLIQEKDGSGAEKNTTKGCMCVQNRVYKSSTSSNRYDTNIPIGGGEEERRRLFEAADGTTTARRRMERKETIEKWQYEWERTADVAQTWTKKLIPNIREWIECDHRKVDYYLTQVHTAALEHTQNELARRMMNAAYTVMKEILQNTPSLYAEDGRYLGTKLGERLAKKYGQKKSQ